MNKSKILIIENSVAVTGALTSILRTVDRLQSDYLFSFILPKGSAAKKLVLDKGISDVDELNLREIRKSFFSVLFYVPSLLVNAYLLRKIVKRKKIDLIHINDLYNLTPPVAWLFGLRIPYVCHVRFLPDRFPWILFRFWIGIHLLLAEKVIVVSDVLRRRLSSHSKIIFIPDGLPGEEKYPIVSLRNAKPFVFLYLSNFMQGKGQDLALEAFNSIHLQIPDWRMRFVGGDMGMEKNKTFIEEQRKKAMQHAITDKIDWVGFTDDPELEYKSSDIVLNFSESESFSMTCQEALFYGRPLIATDCGGPAEIIDDKKTGLLVQNRNVLAMADAMLYLATHPEKQKKMASEARTVIREKFSEAKTSYIINEAYRLILNSAK